MLKQRLITAAVLLPTVVAAVWWLPTAALYVVFAAVTLAIAWEWSGLAGFGSLPARAGYVGASAAVFAVAWLLRSWWMWAAAAAVVCWVVLGALMSGFAPAQPALAPALVPARAGAAALGLLLMTATLLSIAQLHAHADGAWRLLFVLSLVWIADTGAYFVGRRFGRRKLAPRISPGKTQEGALGGLAAVALWAAGAGIAAFKVHGFAAVECVLLSLAAAVLSIVGDLGISLFKRRSGVKDSGRLLPGHGGVLDRVDSLLAAAPAMALGVWGLGL